MSPTSVAPFPIPMQPPPMTAGEKDMRRDASFPDASESRPMSDRDILSLFEGPVQAMREQAEWLIKCLDRNKGAIDIDLWRGLADVAGDLLNVSDLVLCVPCLRDGKVRLGRGQGFDQVMCDDCEADVMGRDR